MISPDKLFDLVLALAGKVIYKLDEAVCILLLDLWCKFPMLSKGWIFDLTSIASNDGSEWFYSSGVGDLDELTYEEKYLIELGWPSFAAHLDHALSL